jgi:hypothetical protein
MRMLALFASLVLLAASVSGQTSAQEVLTACSRTLSNFTEVSESITVLSGYPKLLDWTTTPTALPNPPSNSLLVRICPKSGDNTSLFSRGNFAKRKNSAKGKNSVCFAKIELRSSSGLILPNVHRKKSLVRMLSHLEQMLHGRAFVLPLSNPIALNPRATPAPS